MSTQNATNHSVYKIKLFDVCMLYVIVRLPAGLERT